jgi:hypothetical protein
MVWPMKKVALLTTWVVPVCVLALGLAQCARASEKSATLARAHVTELEKLAREDAREVREGLPRGAEALEKIVGTDALGPEMAREALTKARDKVQDLRTAKSTFFALANPDGIVIRNDQDQDRMAQQPLFVAFPALKGAVTGGYTEARGSMPEAAEVRGRPDAQWVAAMPVRSGGATRALYVTGWSWTGYAYRLQTSLRGSVRASLEPREKEPLIYVYVVVDQATYGTRDSPDVNMQKVGEAKLLERVRGREPFSEELDITGRAFGLAAALAPGLGPNIAIAVLRSET